MTYSLCQLLTHGRWYSLSTYVYSTTNADRYAVTKLLLKGPLKNHSS